MEEYQLQCLDINKKTLLIKWAQHRADYVRGDFYVRAIKRGTNSVAHNKAKGQKHFYTNAYTLAKARDFILTIGNLNRVHDCIGLALEDEHSYVDFDNPIRFRTMPSLTIGASTTINASAIRRRTWYEDTETIISAIWGKEKVKPKIGEWKLPQELAEQGSLEYKIKK